MAMPVDLPAELERRVQAAAVARGVAPEQVVIEAIEAQFGATEHAREENLFGSLSSELRRMAFDGSLRAEIDTLVDDPELAVG
ncbi:MAG: hypothetical protein ACT4PI_12005 [Actinomycetota bacterium]